MGTTSLPDQVNTDIRNAVNAGKIVTTQSTPVTYAGGQFTGYIVIDPATGSGAYLLGNGANGGHVEVASSISSLLSFWTALKAAVLGKFASAAAKHMIKAMVKSVEHMLAIVGLTADAFQIAATCSGNGIVTTLLVMTAYFAFIFAIMLSISFLGPFAAIIAGVFLAYFSSYYKNFLFESAECKGL